MPTCLIAVFMVFRSHLLVREKKETIREECRKFRSPAAPYLAPRDSAHTGRGKRGAARRGHSRGRRRGAPGPAVFFCAARCRHARCQYAVVCPARFRLAGAGRGRAGLPGFECWNEK